MTLVIFFLVLVDLVVKQTVVAAVQVVQLHVGLLVIGKPIVMGLHVIMVVAVCVCGMDALVIVMKIVERGVRLNVLIHVTTHVRIHVLTLLVRPQANQIHLYTKNI
jgi:hypothetical protein